MEFSELNLNTSDTSLKKRVAVYCRINTDSISETPSFLTQQRYFLDYVRRHPDLHIVAMYCDDKGFPALKSNGFKTLLSDAEAEKFDLILMKRMDSFSYSLKVFMQIVDHLLHLPKPVGIMFEEEHLNTLDSQNEYLLRILRTVARTFNNDRETSCQYLDFMNRKAGDEQHDIHKAEAIK